MEDQTSLSMLHDFVAETKGYCFLCSKTNPRLESNIYSLHCLARYLKLDMTKVFTGSGPMPPHLVDRLAKSRLKAELCGECAKLTKKFSKLYRQLEKVEMEMGSCLDVIHGKLDRATKLDTLSHAKNWNDSSRDEWIAKLQITEALRKDTMQKCSRKMGSRFPSTKLERLTPQQVNAITVKLLKTKSRSTSDYYSDLKFENEHAGSPPSVASDEDRSNHVELEHPIHSPMEVDNYVMDLGKVKQEVVEGTSYSNEVHANNEEGEVALELHRQTPTTSQPTKPFENFRTTTMAPVRNSELGQLSQTIPPPIEVANPDASKTTSQYKCQTCKKNFNLTKSYRSHYLRVHIGVRYKCSECDKTFVEKSHLIYHQNSVHLGKAFECKHCSKTFSMPHHRNFHMKSCPGQRN